LVIDVLELDVLGARRLLQIASIQKVLSFMLSFKLISDANSILLYTVKLGYNEQIKSFGWFEHCLRYFFPAYNKQNPGYKEQIRF
jgi:hypothetical protein